MTTVADEPKTEANGKAEAPPSVQLALFENRTVNEVEIQLGGKIVLNLENPEHVKLYESMRLGKAVGLFVSGAVLKRNHRVRRDKEDYLSDTIGTTVVKLDSVRQDPSWVAPSTPA